MAEAKWQRLCGRALVTLAAVLTRDLSIGVEQLGNALFSYGDARYESFFILESEIQGNLYSYGYERVGERPVRCSA